MRKKKVDVRRSNHMSQSHSDKTLIPPKFETETQINPTLNLKDHPINAVLRNSNAFLAETFLKSGDKKTDLKKVQ